MKQEIFDYIADSVGIYLSDLKYGVKRKSIIAVLNSIPDDMYSLEEWKNFLYYLREEDTDFNSIDEVRTSAVQYYKDVK